MAFVKQRLPSLGGTMVSAFNVRALDAYAPVSATCPSGSLVRPATGLSSSETSYIASRKPKASSSLSSWLKKTNSGFSTTNLPTLVLTTSGGGYRSLLSSAGVVQGLDARDSNVGTSGVYQGLTYHAGLSGGGWLLSSIAGNNYPTVTNLKTTLWETAFQDSLLLPDNILAAAALTQITLDITAKEAAGFNISLTDPYGRLLSYQLLKGTDGGVATRMSSITGFSNFTSFNAPYPIISSLGVKTWEGECQPGPNATQYEFHPYEFGSWDSGVSAFIKTPYLGTSLNNGAPTGSSCTMNFDNLGFILGTSSNLFNTICKAPPSGTSNYTEVLTEILDKLEEVTTEDLYALYRNPFRGYSRSSLVSAQSELHLVDGGEALQNNPIWPFIQSTKRADVLIVNDNSADTSNNFPNGSEILTTYVQAQATGLSRMPFIPSVDTFISQGLNKRATFFGCDDNSQLTIIYLPNTAYTYNSGQSTAKLEYTVAETDAMIANGVQIATQNGTSGWPTCLGCAIVKKTGGTLPSACTACFNKYCYRQS
ncbi:lysophospholipase [Rhizodiscina lignyota]|uniref:Lysophospholipase n=1 Tax=Rhizodiscina lignyota TaxID=1504668 RepID=A0A9P4IF64_9PEZI|nr:lysophospholipase [Rhizodiscina lignyota]